MITIRPACLADADAIVPHLRNGDLAETLALGDPVAITRRSVEMSEQAWCALDGDLRVALWGWVQFADGKHVWCVTGRGVERHKRRMLRENRAFVASLDGPLWACVLADYERARRWLAWLGFRETDTIAVDGNDFIKVERDGTGDGNSWRGYPGVR